MNSDLSMSAERRHAGFFRRRLAWFRALDIGLGGKHGVKLVLGGAIVLALVLGGVFAPQIAPVDPTAQSIKQKLAPPMSVAQDGQTRYLGTDFLGRDVLSRIVHGTRISLIIGVASVALSAIVGLILGAVAGFYGGLVDEAISKVSEVFLAFPFLLLAIVIMAFLGPGLGNMILALVLSRWVNFARIMRGEVMALKSRDYVTAARALGASDIYLLVRHILPHTLPILTVIATFEVALVIIYESSLSFLGLGLPPSIPTWGSMLADARTYMYSAPWNSIFPGLAIFITVLGINLLGDGLRDKLDPRHRTSQSR